MGNPDSCSARFEDAAAEITRLEALAPQRSEDACLASFCNEKLFNPAEQARESVPAWDDAVADALRIERVYESFRLRTPSRQAQKKPSPQSTQAQIDRERAEIERMKAKFAAVDEEDADDAGSMPPAPARRAPPPADDGPEGEELKIMRERLASVLNEAPDEGETVPPAKAPVKAGTPAASVEANRSRLEALKREIEDRARRRRDELARAETAKTAISRKAVEASLAPAQNKAEKAAESQQQSVDDLMDSRRKKLDSLKNEMREIEKKLENNKGKKEANRIVKQLIAHTPPGTGKLEDKERRLAELVRRLKDLEED